MKEQWSKIGKRLVAILLICTVSTAAIWFGGTRIKKAITTSSKQNKEDIVIVLDAGHGGYVLSRVII